MKKLFFQFISIILLIYLAGCSEDTVTNKNNNTSQGGLNLYILSEGSSPATGKLSLYTSSNDSLHPSIYSGNLSYPDGLILDGGNLFMVEQGPSFGGPGKLYKLDMNGNLLNSSQPFGQGPYSLAVVSNKVFVTNGPASSVTVLDKSTLSVTGTIPVGVYPQEILAVGNKVFVCNTSAYNGSSDSTVSVIDAASNNVIKTILLRKEPTSIFYKSGLLFVGCKPAAMIYKISPDSLAKLDSFNISHGFEKDISFSNDGNSVNFLDSNNNISKLDYVNRTLATVVSNPDPVNNHFYGYTYIDKHYILDAKNFVTNGRLYIYGTSGSLERTFITGVAPRRTAFAVIVITP